MKSFLLIGMGTFGHHLCRNLAKQKKNEIMIVDKRPEPLEDLLSCVVSAKVGDCCDEKVLRTFDVPTFDACFVCIGGDFQSSIQIASLLRELGAKRVIAKAEQDVQAKFLLRNGADEIIFPERDIAERIAVSESNNNIFDFIELTDEYAIYEIKPLKKWIGKTLRELSFRAVYDMNILAAKREGKLLPLPTADYVIKEEEHLMVVAKKQDIHRVTR